MIVFACFTFHCMIVCLFHFFFGVFFVCLVCLNEFDDLDANRI